MKAGNMYKPQNLREHVLTPLLLVMANITLGIAAYLMHQLYVVQYSHNPMLLRTYNLVDDRAWQSTTNYFLVWAVIFVISMVMQLVSIKVSQNMLCILVLLASIGAIGLWLM